MLWGPHFCNCICFLPCCSNSRSTHLTFEVDRFLTKYRLINIDILRHGAKFWWTARKVQRMISFCFITCLIWQFVGISCLGKLVWNPSSNRNWVAVLGPTQKILLRKRFQQDFWMMFLFYTSDIQESIINGDLDPFCDIVQLFLTYDFLWHGFSGWEAKIDPLACHNGLTLFIYRLQECGKTVFDVSSNGTFASTVRGPRRWRIQDFCMISTSKSSHFPRNFQELEVSRKLDLRSWNGKRIIDSRLVVEDGCRRKVHSKSTFETTLVLAQAELGKDPNLPKTEVPREKAKAIRRKDQAVASLFVSLFVSASDGLISKLGALVALGQFLPGSCLCGSGDGAVERGLLLVGLIRFSLMKSKKLLARLKEAISEKCPTKIKESACQPLMFVK